MFWQRVSLLIIFLGLFACADHNNIMDSKIRDLQNNNLQRAEIEGISVSENSNSFLLLEEEKSRLAFITNNTDISIDSNIKIKMFYNYLDERSKIGVIHTTQQTLASTILDDRSLSYNGNDFERALINFYQALNYLKENDLNKAMVEIRAASDIQKYAIAIREKEIIKAEEKLQEYQLPPEIQASVEESKSLTNKLSIKANFLNPYIYYISGNIRELAGDTNGALIDYKQALEIAPNNMFVIKDALRLSDIYDKPYQSYLLRSKAIKYTPQQDYKKENTVVVIYEQGFLPSKISTNGQIFWFVTGINISLPAYKDSKESPNLIKIKYGDGKSVQATELSNTFVLAKNYLTEQYPTIIIRQATRITTKLIAQQGLNSDNAALQIAGIAGVISSAFEKADTRSFRTLPHYVQTAKISTKESIKDISLVIDSKNIEIPIALELKNGEIALVNVVDTGGKIYYSILYKNSK